MSIESLGDNKFIFQFTNEKDKRRILVGEPSYRDNFLIMLEEPKGIGDTNKLEFSRVTFWIQIHNIPILCMNKETAFFFS